MALTVGGTPVKSVYVGSTPVESVYVGSTLVWQAVKEVVQITLGTGFQARDQLWSALSARGLDYTTVTEIPFDIELVGTGSTIRMFRDYAALTTVPEMDTSQVTNMGSMFRYCSSLTYVPNMDTNLVTSMQYMFQDCAALTDGKVRLIGKHPEVVVTSMIAGSGLTRAPFYSNSGIPI